MRFLLLKLFVILALISCESKKSEVLEGKPLGQTARDIKRAPRLPRAEKPEIKTVMPSNPDSETEPKTLASTPVFEPTKNLIALKQAQDPDLSRTGPNQILYHEGGSPSYVGMDATFVYLQRGTTLWLYNHQLVLQLKLILKDTPEKLLLTVEEDVYKLYIKSNNHVLNIFKWRLIDKPVPELVGRYNMEHDFYFIDAKLVARATPQALEILDISETDKAVLTKSFSIKNITSVVKHKHWLYVAREAYLDTIDLAQNARVSSVFIGKPFKLLGVKEPVLYLENNTELQKIALNDQGWPTQFESVYTVEQDLVAPQLCAEMGLVLNASNQFLDLESGAKLTHAPVHLATCYKNILVSASDLELQLAEIKINSELVRLHSQLKLQPENPLLLTQPPDQLTWQKITTLGLVPDPAPLLVWDALRSFTFDTQTLTWTNTQTQQSSTPVDFIPTRILKSEIGVFLFAPAKKVALFDPETLESTPLNLELSGSLLQWQYFSFQGADYLLSTTQDKKTNLQIFKLVSPTSIVEVERLEFNSLALAFFIAPQQIMVYNQGVFGLYQIPQNTTSVTSDFFADKSPLQRWLVFTEKIVSKTWNNILALQPTRWPNLFLALVKSGSQANSGELKWLNIEQFSSQSPPLPLMTFAQFSQISPINFGQQYLVPTSEELILIDPQQKIKSWPLKLNQLNTSLAGDFICYQTELTYEVFCGPSLLTKGQDHALR